MSRSTPLRASAVVVVGSPWLGAARAGAGPYGPLLPPNGDGLALPEGFTSRTVARSGRKVAGLKWHAAPAGGACFPDGDGWIYVSNAKVPLLGGASALCFGSNGTVIEAYRVLSGTTLNAAGGATPWNTWLSCEETESGRVFECDPYGERAARPRLAMGRFRHEAAACDPERQVVYLTEDEPDGCFYRFRPRDWGDLTEGTLEVLAMGGVWRPVPHPAAPVEPTRFQVPDALRFDGAEGCHYADGVCSFTTRGDGRVWSYTASTGRLEAAGGPEAGERFVVRGGGPMEISVITRSGEAAPFARLEGHGLSTPAGPAFSPDGTRLYLSSQRGRTGARAGTDGHTFEVTGPFRG
ncbi:alkaline phosphatase PhoX [Nonomuraea sp. NPDC050790]|uniref:alkaline phosphatase PhoX n=1 Tax=Nonomuraea sp. NPDC050790 TaxID=3364371 RepID=UPI0037BD74CA